MYTIYIIYFSLLVKLFAEGICGGSASGKTTVAKKIIEDLGVPWVCLLSMDSFYKVHILTFSQVTLGCKCAPFKVLYIYIYTDCFCHIRYYQMNNIS